VLQCFRIAPQNADAAPQGPNLSLRYHYDTQRIEELAYRSLTEGPVGIASRRGPRRNRRHARR
jgi:hypothetical protein